MAASFNDVTYFSWHHDKQNLLAPPKSISNQVNCFIPIDRFGTNSVFCIANLSQPAETAKTEKTRCHIGFF